MRILVVSQFYYPEPFQKLKDLCEGFVKAGHRVTVLTGLPNYPSGIIPEQYRKGQNRHECINGVLIERLSLIARGQSVLGLALNYASWSIVASIKALFWKERFNVVFCYQTSPVFVLFPAWLLKLRNRCRLIGYCLDQWPVSLLAVLKSKTSLLYRFTGIISGWLYRRCDILAVTSRPFIDYLCQEHKIPAGCLRYIPQHGNDLYLAEDFSKKDDGPTRFLFTGNMGRAQDIGTILSAVKLIREGLDFVVEFVGSGSVLLECERYVQQEKLQDRVHFLGRKPYAELPEFYRRADACLVSLRHDNEIGLTLPGKMQDYLAVGKPIIGAIDGAGREVIDEAQCGICVKAGDAASLSGAMEEFIRHRDKYFVFGENARRYYKEHFTTKEALTAFLGLFEETRGESKQ